MYFIEDKPFPIFPRAVEQILYDVSVRSTGALASVMRKTDVRPRIVHTKSDDMSMTQIQTVMDGMRTLLDQEAKGRLRRCSIITIKDCVTSLSAIDNVKAKLVLDFFQVEDDSSYLSRPNVQEEKVRKRLQTDHFQFAQATQKRVRISAVSSHKPRNPTHKPRNLTHKPRNPTSSLDTLCAAQTETDSVADAWQDDTHNSLKAIRAVCKSTLSL